MHKDGDMAGWRTASAASCRRPASGPMVAGLLTLALGAVELPAVTPPPDHQIAIARSKEFELHYKINEAAYPLEAVEVWFTQDSGRSWQLFGLDGDTRSPARFRADAEGLYGFYIIAKNGAGASDKSPDDQTTPQQWAFVDYTVPLVQLHDAVPAPDFAESGVLTLRWSVIDANVGARGLALSFRRADLETWSPIARGISNTGSYDWSIPNDITSPVVIKLTVRDRGGHVVEKQSDPISFDQIGSPHDVLTAGSNRRAKVGAGGPESVHFKPVARRDDAVALKKPARFDKDKANELYQLGSWYRVRGEHDLAAQKMREALALTPDSMEGLLDLAGILYANGQYGHAIQAYQNMLARYPDHSEALDGLALSHAARKEYGAAARCLKTLLNRDESNARAWLELGDISLMTGDRPSATTYWQKAATIDHARTEITDKARRRLADLPSLAGRYSTRKTGK